MNKLILFIVVTLLFSTEILAQNLVLTDDFKTILGDWTGTLTYIDYSSNKPYSMPANLSVNQGKTNNQLTLYNSYPKEPKANNKDKIKISKNGSLINKHAVKSREKLTNGQVQIITEYDGKDNRQKALIRSVYILGEDQFIIRKEVKFVNSDDWIKRSEFKYKR